MISQMQHRPSALRALVLAAAASCLVGVACSEQGGSLGAPTPAKPAAPADAAPATQAPPAQQAEEPVDLATRGRQVYMANCIACHSQDPAMDGALGPAVTGASRELLEARVLRAEYPDGYTPKRPSKVMIALPHLGGEIDALTAFLAAGS
ncbi:MAG: cytochrome c [Actinomycetota bacterium]|nr:cytochrome c [Actinomycetota bacterium]